MLHLADDIMRFGSPRNFYGGIGESHLKMKCKQPARRASKVSHLFEQSTGRGDIERIAINCGVKEIELQSINEDDSVLLINKHQKLGFHFFAYKGIHNNVMFKCRRLPWNKVQKLWKGPMSEEQLITLINALPIESGNSICFHSEYNNITPEYKLRGHVCYNKRAWQDWALAVINGKEYQINIMMFVIIDTIDIGKILSTELDDVDAPGKYAIVHYCPCKADSIDMYGNIEINYYHAKYNSFSVDDNCSLITWNSKRTNEMYRWKSKNLVMSKKRNKLMATLCFVKVENIIKPLIAIPDKNADIPFTYMFIISKKDWNLKLLKQYINHSDNDSSSHSSESDELLSLQSNSSDNSLDESNHSEVDEELSL
jgi:hypothetical protein